MPIEPLNIETRNQSPVTGKKPDWSEVFGKDQKRKTPEISENSKTNKATENLHSLDLRQALDPDGLYMDFSPPSDAKEDSRKGPGIDSGYVNDLIKGATDTVKKATGLSFLPSAESLLGKKPVGDKPETVEKPESNPMMDTLIGLFGSQNLAMLENINSFKVEKGRNQREHRVTVDLIESAMMPAPRAKVTGLGPLGGVTAKPNDSYVNDFAFTLRSDPKDADHFTISGMQGFDGSSDLYRRGRKFSSRSGSTEWMDFDVDGTGNARVNVKSSGLDNAISLNKAHFDNSSMTGKLINDPEFRSKTLKGIDAFQANIDSLKFTRLEKGKYDIEVDPKIDQLPLNQPLKDLPGFTATNLYFKQDGAVKARLDTSSKQPRIDFKKGDLQVSLQAPLGSETKMSVESIFSVKDATGKTSLKIKFHGLPGEYDLP